MRELNIPATTHGRLLVDDGPPDAPLTLLVGCHGYAQSAEDMMKDLHTIAPGAALTRVAVQALHRFYRGRSEFTVASWMTRQDREQAIVDNVAYLDAAIAQAAAGRPIDRLVICGFSQGVAMAFRAALLGARKADAVLALGGDVPPELADDAAWSFPRVLLARGRRDTWYSDEKFRRDDADLRRRGAHIVTLTFDGGHEWHDDFRARAAELLSGL